MGGELGRLSGFGLGGESALIPVANPVRAKSATAAEENFIGRLVPILDHVVHAVSCRSTDFLSRIHRLLSKPRYMEAMESFGG